MYDLTLLPERLAMRIAIGGEELIPPAWQRCCAICTAEKMPAIRRDHDCAAIDSYEARSYQEQHRIGRRDAKGAPQ